MDLGSIFWFLLGGFAIWYVLFDGDSFVRVWYRRFKRRILGGL